MNYLILIDCQNDFIDGALRNEAAIECVPRICDVIKKWHGIVLATMDSHVMTMDEKSLEFRTVTPHCLVGSSGWNMPMIIKNALNYQGSYAGHVEKRSFGTTELFNRINRLEINFSDTSSREYVLPKFTLMGFDTDICVVSNALILRAQFPNSEICVIEDCCAGTTLEKHKAALDVMRSCNIQTITFQEYVSEAK